jgi:hypothetical protein
MPRNRLRRLIKNHTPKGRGTKEDHWRDFWLRETRMGQQVAQVLECYMMMMIKRTEIIALPILKV